MNQIPVDMSIITKIEGWGNSHRPGWLDVLRIILGIFITYKGAIFASNIQSLETSIKSVNMIYTGVALAHYIIFAHILGGPLIAFGLLTRIMCFIQVPILLGAVLLVNYKDFVSVGSPLEFEVSLLVLLGLITFMIFGAGKYSIDEKRRQEKRTQQQA
jgi:putative oxidoreductase